MWNQIACNRIIEDKFRRQNTLKFVLRIAAAKSIVNVNQPENKLIRQKQKTMSLYNLEQNKKIKKQNSLLLRKIATLHSKSKDNIFYKTKHKNKTSLNQSQKILQIKQISASNKNFVRRLITTESFYKNNFSNVQPQKNKIIKAQKYNKIRSQLSKNHNHEKFSQTLNFLKGQKAKDKKLSEKKHRKRLSNLSKKNYTEAIEQ